MTAPSRRHASPMGTEVPRFDGPDKVTGAGRYAADHHPTGLVHGHLVLSTIARGRIRRMHTGAARRAPGVLRVYTPANNLRLRPSGQAALVPLQDDRISFRGQIIGLVIAETIEQARDAAALVTVDYAEQTPRTTIIDGERADAPEDVVTVLARGTRSVAEAHRRSEVDLRITVSQPAQHHVAMELHATTAQWRDGVLTVHMGTQAPQIQADTIAEMLGLQPEQVRLICRFTGGGFGCRAAEWGDSALAAAAARELNRPVRVGLSREQTFAVVGHRGAAVQSVRLGATRGGRLTALTHESDAELPAIGAWSLQPGYQFTDVLYRTPNMHIEHRHLTFDTGPTTPMRAPNEAPGAFALETAMDELAVRLRMDPMELRLRNLASVVPGSDTPFSSKHLDECYRRGAASFGWGERSLRPGMRAEGDWWVGSGMASAIYHATRETASARIRFGEDGNAQVAAAVSDFGTGSLTMLAITAADALGLPLARVRSLAGDSALPAGGSPGYGSQVTFSTVPAIQAAARNAIDRLIDLAVGHQRSPWHGEDRAALRYQGGVLIGPRGRLSFQQLLRAIGRPFVGSTMSTERPAEHERYSFYNFGAHFCAVRVHRETGEVRVSRFTSVFDIGRVVNARAARSQLIGGIVMGIGGALLEGDPIEPSGRYAHGNLAEYLVPVHADVPVIDVQWLDRPDPVINELGARSAGEISVVGAAAAIGNAVYNATGVRVRELPITLDKIIDSLP